MSVFTGVSDCWHTGTVGLMATRHSLAMALICVVTTLPMIAKHNPALGSSDLSLVHVEMATTDYGEPHWKELVFRAPLEGLGHSLA